MDIFNARSDSAPTFIKIFYLYKRGIEGNSKTQPIQAGFKWTVFYQSSFKWNRSSLLFFFQIMKFLMWCPLESGIISLSFLTWLMTVETKLTSESGFHIKNISFCFRQYFFFSKFCWSLCKRAIVSCDSDKEHGK